MKRWWLTPSTLSSKDTPTEMAQKNGTVGQFIRNIHAQIQLIVVILLDDWIWGNYPDSETFLSVFNVRHGQRTPLQFATAAPIPWPPKRIYSKVPRFPSWVLAYGILSLGNFMNFQFPVGCFLDLHHTLRKPKLWQLGSCGFVHRSNLSPANLQP